MTAAFVFGLGLAHHRTIALLLPAALVFILWASPTLIRQPRRWALPLLCALAPLLLYLYLPIRGRVVTSLDGTYAATLRGTLDWITARGYSVFLSGNPFGIQREAGDIFALFLEQLGALTLVAAIAGMFLAWRFGRRRPAFLLLATLTEIAFASAYKVQDVEVFFIPAFMLICIWAAQGIAPSFDEAMQRARRAARPFPATWVRTLLLCGWTLSLTAVLLFEPARNAVRNLPALDRHTAWEVYDAGQDRIASIAPGGRVIGLLGETTLVRYFRDVLGQRPDVEVVPADAEAARLAAADAALAVGKAVYLTARSARRGGTLQPGRGRPADRGLAQGDARTSA